MCTLTWARRPDGYSVFFNRDELRTRGPGIPPTEGICRQVPFLAPRDSDAGGTWIAVSARGLVLCLLNGYVDDAAPPPAPGAAPEPRRSAVRQEDTAWITRGSLIDGRIGDTDATAVAEAVRGQPLERFRSFVLCAFDPAGVAWRIAWLHRQLDLQALTGASMPVSSSSFDTPAVLAERRAQWRERFANPTSGTDTGNANRTAARHRAFHRQRHGDPARGAYSVCMSRPDACTVSYTEIDVEPDQVRMRYLGAPPCDAGPPTSERSLPRSG